MKKVIVFILFGMMIIVHAWLVSAGEEAHQKIVDLAQSKLVPVATDPVIVAGVKAENDMGKFMDQTNAMD